MNWKMKQRHLAEMRWKKRGHNRIEIPPVPKPVKVLKVCNPIKDFLEKLIPKTPKAPNLTGDPIVIGIVDRWGTPTAVPKTSPFKCPFNFIDKLEKRGYKVLGRGAYSTVLGKEGSNKVIKVSRSLDDWIDYVQWGAANGYAGNFVPRVYSWKRHTRPGEKDDFYGRTADWSVAVVERMADTCSDHKHDMSLLYSLYYPANSGNTMAAVYMEDLCPGSYKFFKELDKNHFASDIGGKNMMIRADGSFCVTGPVRGRIKTDKKRFRTGDFYPSVLLVRKKSLFEILRNYICNRLCCWSQLAA